MKATEHVLRLKASKKWVSRIEAKSNIPKLTKDLRSEVAISGDVAY